MCRGTILILTAFSLVLNLVNAVLIQRLINDLFRDSDYNKYAQPERPLKVNLLLQLEEIKEINDVHEKMVSRVRIHIEWLDNRTKWKNTPYGGLAGVMVPQDLVWKPDIALLNGVTEVQTIGNSYTPVRLYYKGKNQWSPVNIFETKCDFDLEFYPFDIQRCEIHIGAISSSNYHIALQRLKCLERERVLETSTWRLIRSKKSVRENAIHYKMKRRQKVLVCTYFLQRKSSFYFTNILLPLIFLGIMNPLAFLIPYDSGERISFSMTLFLTFAVFVTIMMEKVPVNSDKTSYLQLYLICQLAITVFILMFTTIRVRLLTGSKSKHRNTVAPENTLDTISGNVQAWQESETVDELEIVNDRKRRVYAILKRICKVTVKGIIAKVDICTFLLVCIMQITSNVWFYVSVTTGSKI